LKENLNRYYNGFCLGCFLFSFHFYPLLLSSYFRFSYIFSILLFSYISISLYFKLSCHNS
jgi:hypothetical protein